MPLLGNVVISKKFLRTHRIMKMYEYINRIVLTLPLSVYEGTWTHSPLSLLCITMILRVRRKVFEITTFPNSGIRARFMRRCYMHE